MKLFLFPFEIKSDKNSSFWIYFDPIFFFLSVLFLWSLCQVYLEVSLISTSDTHVCSHDLDISHINDHSWNLISDQSVNSERLRSLSHPPIPFEGSWEGIWRPLSNHSDQLVIRASSSDSSWSLGASASVSLLSSPCLDGLGNRLATLRSSAIRNRQILLCTITASYFDHINSIYTWGILVS